MADNIQLNALAEALKDASPGDVLTIDIPAFYAHGDRPISHGARLTVGEQPHFKEGSSFGRGYCSGEYGLLSPCVVEDAEIVELSVIVSATGSVGNLRTRQVRWYPPADSDA